MSEKTTKRLRRATKGTSLTSSGMRALRKLYRATPRKQRASFSVPAAIARLQQQEILRRSTVMEMVQEVKHVRAVQKKRRRKNFLLAPFTMLATLTKAAVGKGRRTR